MNSQLNENTEVVDLINQNQATQNVGNGTRKARPMKTNPRAKRGHINRKRNREGQLAGVTRSHEEQVPVQSVGTSEPAASNGSIEIIDVEQVKDNPVVDLTRESGNNICVDLTTSPEMQPHHRQSVIRYQSCVGNINTSKQNKNTDEIVIVGKGSEGIVNVVSQPSPSLNDDIMTCAICMDDFNQIKKAKRQLTSTTCGHVFCDPCITSSIRAQSKCPTCRKRLTKRSLHPIFL